MQHSFHTGEIYRVQVPDSMTRFEKALLLLFGLNALDIVLTLTGVSMLGAVELNGLMAALISYHPLLFVTVKVLVMSTIVWLVYKRYHDGTWCVLRWQKADPSPFWAWAILGPAIVIFLAMVLWNTSVIVTMS